MRPLLVVEIGVGSQHPVEVAIARDQQPVEAFGSHGPDLRDRVGSVGVSTLLAECGEGRCPEPGNSGPRSVRHPMESRCLELDAQSD